MQPWRSWLTKELGSAEMTASWWAEQLCYIYCRYTISRYRLYL